jgi:hypothetical protein
MKVNNLKLFSVSFVVFIIINTFENLIHFSIGRNANNKDSISNFSFAKPSKYDILKILAVMILFASLQGIATGFFYHFEH